MKLSLTFFLLFIASTAMAQDFEERSIDEFKTLDQFDSVNKFENHIEDYVQECLDNSYGGSLSKRCFVSSELWDRELNKYYKLLRNELSEKQKKKLKDAQKSWIETRDKTIQFNSSLLENKYDKRGTMYAAMRSDDASSTISPIIKQRALLLRDWYLSLSEN